MQIPSLLLSLPKSNSNSLMISAHSQLGYCPCSPSQLAAPGCQSWRAFVPHSPGSSMREPPCQHLPAWQRCPLCQQHRTMFSVWQRISSCPPPHFLSNFPSQKSDFTKSDKANRESSKGKAKVSKVRQSTCLANNSNKSTASTKYQK